MQTAFAGGEEVRPVAAFAVLMLTGAVLAPRTARWAGVIVVMIAVLTLVHYAVEPGPAVDPFLGEGGMDLRMAVRSALAAGLAAMALLARRRGLAQLLAAGAGFVALVSLVADWYGAEFLPHSTIAEMPRGTAVLFLLWAIAFVVSTSHHGIVADLLARDRWAATMRRMALIGVIAPAVFGALCLLAVEAHVFDLRFAVAMVVTATAFTFVATTTILMARIRDREALYRTIVETTQDGICILANGHLTFVNDRLAQLLGSTPENMIGSSFREHVAPRDHAAVEERAAARQRGDVTSTRAELRLLHAEGSELTFVSAATPIRRGDDSALLVTLTDITEREASREALERAHEVLSARVAALEGVEAVAAERASDVQRHQEEIAGLAERLAEANRELEMFSYSVSHDLRAPLRAVDGFSRELMSRLDAHLDERSRRYFQRVLAAAQRMSTLIDDLLRLSRLSRAALRRERVDVTAVATEIADGRSAVHVEPGLTAWADAQLLRVVLENVIGNAIKFSSTRPDPRVDVFAAGHGVIAVRDNGIGFDMQYADKIFGPFQRLDHSAAFEGTGIGLALAQRIVHRHGGSIRAEAEPGRGATFYLSFGDPADETHPAR